MVGGRRLTGDILTCPYETQLLSMARAAATNCGIIDRYFDLLEETVDVYELCSRPCLIFNMDETGMPLNPKPSKVIVGSKVRNPCSIVSGDKTQITVVGCVSASGFCMPPMVIWDRKTLSAALSEGEVPGTTYGLSERGWMDSDFLMDGFVVTFYGMLQ